MLPAFNDSEEVHYSAYPSTGESPKNTAQIGKDGIVLVIGRIGWIPSPWAKRSVTTAQFDLPRRHSSV